MTRSGSGFRSAADTETPHRRCRRCARGGELTGSGGGALFSFATAHRGLFGSNGDHSQ